MQVIGNPRLLVQINAVVKSHHQSARPFICFVINPQGMAEIHTNMDINGERIHLVHSCLEKLKEMGSGLIVTK